MKTDHIKEIKIDNAGRLCIIPEKERFTMIWRSAAEVHWDSDNLFLYSPKPREWSYVDWFKYILNTVKSEYSCNLLLTDSTLWSNVSESIKREIVDFSLYYNS